MSPIKISVSLDRGFSVFPFEFIPNRVKNTDDEIPYIDHETTHCKRQSWLVLIWLVRYFVSESFRFNEEALAYTNEIKAYLNLNKGYNLQTLIDEKATSMSTSYYGMCTFDKAKTKLTELTT